MMACFLYRSLIRKVGLTVVTYWEPCAKVFLHEQFWISTTARSIVCRKPDLF